MASEAVRPPARQRVPPKGLSGLAGLLPGGGGDVGGGAVNAGIGNADILGELSVPPNWAQVSGASSGAARVAHHTMTSDSAMHGRAPET